MDPHGSSRLDGLRREGWTRRFTASEPRLSEAVAMYKESGFEVHLEPLPPAGDPEFPTFLDSGNGCTRCFEETRDQCKIIFTRPRDVF